MLNAIKMIRLDDEHLTKILQRHMQDIIGGVTLNKRKVYFKGEKEGQQQQRKKWSKLPYWINYSINPI